MAKVRGWVPALAASVALLGGCSSEKALYPPAGSVTLQVKDGGLGLQKSLSPSFQAVRWVLDEATIEIEGFGEYGLLGRVPCFAWGNVLVAADLTTQCGGSPLSLRADEPRGVGVRLAVSSMEACRAWRPDLPDGGDYDGDGIENAIDNCVIVPNPDQELAPDSTHGLVCGALDWFTGLPTDPDADADGVGDGLDNCVWVANSEQEDSNGDAIGDACARTTRVVLDGQPLRLEFPSISVSVKPAAITSIVVDFDDRKTLVDCDSGLTVCRLDTSQISVSVH